ncbi:MAG: phosphonate metabolism protein/1,5-bisphosphokinase (PRPP-forming) PhnN [Beijerinckiaceae bacterium]
MTRVGRAYASSQRPAMGAGFQIGAFVAVAGPSGAGKDTLIRGVQERLQGDRRFVFARRVITRQGDCTEDHDSVSEFEFARLHADNAFLLSWSANGLRYGLPGGLARDLAEGRIVIANVSRGVLAEVRVRFPRHLIVHVTAAPEILAARLAHRGREDAAAQQARLLRSLQHDPTVNADVTIDNSDDIDLSLAHFEHTLRSLAFSFPLGL